MTYPLTNTDRLAIDVLEGRGVTIPHGSAWCFYWLNPLILSDPAILKAAEDWLAAKVADYADVTPDRVDLHQVTPEELWAAWHHRLTTTDPMFAAPADVGVLVGAHVPSDAPAAERVP